MNVFEKICLEMIDKIERLAAFGDTGGILEYIADKRNQVENCRSMSNDVGKYVDRLEKELK